MREGFAICSVLTEEDEMLEKLIRWIVKNFLKGHHLSHNPTRKNAVINFPKEGTDGDESIFAPGSAGKSADA